MSVMGRPALVAASLIVAGLGVGAGLVLVCAGLIGELPQVMAQPAVTDAGKAPVDDCANVGLNDEELFCHRLSQDGELDVSSQLAQFFQFDQYLGLCKPIFESPQFRDALFKVDAWGTKLSADHFRRDYESPPKAPPVYVDKGEGWVEFYRRNMLRGSLWKLSSGVTHWRYVPIAKADAAGRVHAEISPLDASGRTAQVTFFKTVCAPTQIYGADLSWLDAQARYVFVAAHEIGHLIDYWTGETLTLGKSSIDIEKRATVYGSYFAECWLRLLQQNYGRAVRPDAGPEASAGVPTFRTQRELACALKNWKLAEAVMAKQRQTWESQTWSASDPSALAKSGACRTPWPTDAGQPFAAPGSRQVDAAGSSQTN